MSATKPELRWYRALVRGETPVAGEFYQTLWIARGSHEAAVQAAAETFIGSADRLLEVECCEPVEEPVPSHPDVQATGRAYYLDAKH